MKPIKFVTTPVPNYLTFILCTLGINWKNEYSDTFANFLSQTDREYMLAHQAHLLFGDGAVASLIELFYFLPAHIGFEKDDRIMEYFHMLSQAAVSNDFKQLNKKFHIDIENMRQFNQSLATEFEENIPKELTEIIVRFADIYMRNYDKFLAMVWLPMSEQMEVTKTTVERLFKGKDIIGDWEKLTDFTFRTDSYDLALIPFIKYGPGANSLSYDRNLFLGGSDNETLNYYMFFISHEVGTHLLKEHTLEQFISEREEDWVVAYIAMENIARYYNLKLIQDSYAYSLGEMYYHDSIFEKLYAELEKEFPGEITKQYLTAIERYQR